MTVNKKFRYVFTVSTQGVPKHELYRKSSPTEVYEKGQCSKVQLGNYCLPESPFVHPSESQCERGSISYVRLEPKKSKKTRELNYIIREECMCPYLESPHGFALLLSVYKPSADPYQLTEDDTILSFPFGETALPYCPETAAADEGDGEADTPFLDSASLDIKCPQPRSTCPFYQKNLLEAEDMKKICTSDYVIEVEVLQSPCSKGGSQCGVGQVVNVLKGRKYKFQGEISMSMDKALCPCQFTSGSKVYMANFEQSWVKAVNGGVFVGLALDNNTHVFATSIEDDINNAVEKCI